MIDLYLASALLVLGLTLAIGLSSTTAVALVAGGFLIALFIGNAADTMWDREDR